MGYHVAYVVHPEGGPPEHGDRVATSLGWFNWIEWTAPQAAQYPLSAHLAEEGWLDGPDLPGLEDELRQLLHAAPDHNQAAVTAHLLGALQARPPETLALIITDGTPGETDEDMEGDASAATDITGHPEDQIEQGDSNATPPQ